MLKMWKIIKILYNCWKINKNYINNYNYYKIATMFINIK